MKIYRNVCKKYREFKDPKIPYIFRKSLDLSIVYDQCGHDYKKILKEEESIEILKSLGIITNIEMYQKMYNHIWRKYKSIIQTEKYRNYLIEEINQNKLISKKHNKVYRVLNYIEHLLISISIVSGCISISAFASLVGILQ